MVFFGAIYFQKSFLFFYCIMFSTLTPQAILFFTVSGVLLYIITRFLPDVRAFYHNRVRWQTDITREKYLSFDNILSSHLPYYRRLSVSGKAKFVHRLIQVIQEKEFIGRNKLKVTEEMKVVICGAIVQLTFGMKNFKLSHFERIVLYPEKFYHTLLERHLKGGTSPSGVVMLSWPDVVHGFSDENDNYNLALHELAHALELDVTEGEDFDHHFSSYLDEWLSIGERVMHRMRIRNDVKLREYAKTNMHEFFAVSIENFFETPREMKKNLPNNFNHLCVLLNQDPSNPEDDYELREDFVQETQNRPGIIPVPPRVAINFAYKVWHWSYTVMMLGFFLMISLLIYKEETVIGGLGWKGIAGIAFLTSVGAQFSILYKRDNFSAGHFGIYTLIGTTPLLLFMFFYVNYSTRIPDNVEKYKVAGYYYDNYSNDCFVQLESEELLDNEEMRKTSKLVTDVKQIPLSYIVNYDCGLLGYRIVKGRELVVEPVSKMDHVSSYSTD